MLQTCCSERQPCPGSPQEKAAERFPHARNFARRTFDYDYRPDVLERYPLYYFLAGTKPVATLTSSAWDWHTAKDDEPNLHRYVRYSATRLDERRDHPCYRNGEDPQLWARSKSIKDELGAPVPLLKEDGTRVARADHYRRVRISEPWKVPLLFGCHVAAPRPDDSAEAKARYALKAMILFRSWRCAYKALSDWLGQPAAFAKVSTEEMWNTLYEQFEDWRTELATCASQYVSRDPNTWQEAPVYDSDAWWVCVNTKGLDNLA